MLDDAVDLDHIIVGQWPRLAALRGQPGGLPGQALQLRLIIGIVWGRLQPPDQCASCNLLWWSLQLKINLSSANQHPPSQQHPPPSTCKYTRNATNPSHENLYPDSDSL